jgi:hypothetical protein
MFNLRFVSCERAAHADVAYRQTKRAAPCNIAWTYQRRQSVITSAGKHYTTKSSLLYERTVAARQARRSGLLASMFLLGIGLTFANSANLLPTPNLDVARDIILLISLGNFIVASVIWILQRGQISVEWHSGRLWIELGIPPIWVSSGAPVSPNSIQVSRLLFIYLFLSLLIACLGHLACKGSGSQTLQ